VNIDKAQAMCAALLVCTTGFQEPALMLVLGTLFLTVFTALRIKEAHNERNS